MSSLPLSIERVPVPAASPLDPIDLSNDKAGDFSTALSADSPVCSIGLGSDGFRLEGFGGLLAFRGGEVLSDELQGRNKSIAHR